MAEYEISWTGINDQGQRTIGLVIDEATSHSQALEIGRNHANLQCSEVYEVRAKKADGQLTHESQAALQRIAARSNENVDDWAEKLADDLSKFCD